MWDSKLGRPCQIDGSEPRAVSGGVWTPPARPRRLGLAYPHQLIKREFTHMDLSTRNSSRLNAAVKFSFSFFSHSPGGKFLLFWQLCGERQAEPIRGSGCGAMVTSLIWCHTRMPPQCLCGGQLSNSTPPPRYTLTLQSRYPRRPRRAWPVCREPAGEAWGTPMTPPKNAY